MASRKERVRAAPPRRADDSDTPDDAESSEESSTSDSDQEPEPANPSTEMTFEELLRLQNTVGRKAFQRAAQRPAPEESAQPSSTRPQEISSKKPAPFLRKVLPCKKATRRDPRFDDLSGEYKAEVFEKTYAFLGELKKSEREVVEKKLRKTRQPELKEKLEQLLRRMDQQEAAAHKTQNLRERELDYKRQLRERARQGHKPFYLKKGEKRRRELAEKFGDLRRSGKLQHFLSKKRKRNSIKDRRRLPNQ